MKEPIRFVDYIAILSLDWFLSEGKVFSADESVNFTSWINVGKLVNSKTIFRLFEISPPTTHHTLSKF